MLIKTTVKIQNPMYAVRCERVALAVPENSPVTTRKRVVMSGRPKEKHKIRIYVMSLSGRHHAGSGRSDGIGDKRRTLYLRNFRNYCNHSNNSS